MQKLTFEDICEKLKKGENFSLSRFGDGEWSAILGFRGENCDGHKYFPELSNDLACILKSNPEYYLASHLKTSDRIRKEVEKYIKDSNISVNFSCSSDIFHIAFVKEKMVLLFDSLKDREVLIVGPDYLMSSSKIRYYAFIEVSKNNCFLQTKDIIPRIRKSLKKNIVVIFCASMASNVWIDKLYSPDYTLIDFGSALDPYCGVLSRSFHRKNQHLIN